MSRKKVLFVAPPFSGHLHPLLGVAREVRSVADVMVLSTPGGVRAAREAGLAAREIMAAQESRVWEIAEPGRAVKNHPWLLYRQLKGNVALMVAMKGELDAVFAEERPDLVIADFTVPVAGLSAAALGGVPWWTTLPSVCVFETPDGPPAYFGGQTPADGWPRRLLQATQRRATRGFKRLMWLLFRREFRSIGFHGIYRDDGSEAVYSPHRIVALGALEIEFPRSYPPHFHFAGPSLYTPPFHGPEPVFTNDGRPHVVITLGTHLPQEKAALAAVVREIATRQPGIVFHFSHGKEAGGVAEQMGNFHEYGYVSYADHLPRYDLAVHHAGGGILHHCLRHGVPAVTMPRDFDQFDHAARLVAHGLAMPARNPADLEPAILRALADGALRERCQAMSRAIAAYDAGKTVATWVADSDATGYDGRSNRVGSEIAS